MLITYGHGTESSERTVALLRAARVRLVVDIRIAPGSTRNPQFARPELERWLPEAGIAYRWDKRLGGYRKPSAGNPDIAWRGDMYRGYAEHMRGAEFLAAIDAVLADAATIGDTAAGVAPHRVAVMCSEGSWQHCHRRLVADFAQVARGAPVRHLTHDATLTTHVPSPGLRVRDDGLLVYDSGQSPLFESLS
jgi:uncharacterized protein (DUF488 family)